MLPRQLTPALACDALATVGITVPPEHVTIEARDERFLARLPNGRLAWFATSEDGRTRLMRERGVLSLLAQRCSFRAPRVIATDPLGDFDVRVAVPGTSDPVALCNAIRRDRALAASVGASLGRMLAEQHTRIDASDVAGWLPCRPSWPESREWIRERLPGVIGDAELIAQSDEIISACESVIVATSDRVLAHTDLGPHNVSVDPASFTVHGIFDYEGAAWTDRHHDFRYLLLDEDAALLEAAITAYEPLVGQPIDRRRVRLYHAACAVTYLAFRSGKAPEEDWCGRTLDEDLAWTRSAIRAV